MAKVLRLIGYWRNDDHPEYPDPHDLVDRDWAPDQREAVQVYLAGGLYSRHFMGLSPCRFCGRPNGASELTDGSYAWPEGLTHYVETHNVRLPQAFVDHAVQRLDELDSTEFSLTWWLNNHR